MRPLHIILVALAATVGVVPTVAAQQRNTTQTTTTTQNGMSATQTAVPLVRNPFPVPAARYEILVTKRMQMLRTMRPFGPITQGDINKALLLMRDCASRVEADGVVTQNEMKQCEAVLTAFKRERTREVMASSSPEDWARWGAQAPHH